MKIIVGFTTKPGRRDDYLAAARDHLEQGRLEPDCLYIELVPMPDHPDRILAAEETLRLSERAGARRTHVMIGFDRYDDFLAWKQKPDAQR